MPWEVIRHITSYLTTTELGNLRRVCQHLEKTLFSSFATEFFTKRQFMRTEFSLQTLLEISLSRLAPYLTYLIISTSRPLPIALYNRLPSGPSNPHELRRYNKVYEESVNHNTLINSGHDLELLAQALQNLPNLDTVGLRDFDGSGRYRDGETGRWRSYGAETYSKETGINISQVFPRLDAEPQSDPVSQIFLIILRALGTTRDLHQQPRLEVILRKSHVPEQAFNVPRFLEPVISPVIENLRTLFLDLGHESLQPLFINDSKRFMGYPLAKLLSKASSLEHLRLNFRACTPRCEEANDILLWLARVPTDDNPGPFAADIDMADAGCETELPTLPQASKFPNLKQLDIGMLTIQLPLLVSLVTKYGESLRELSLHKVKLINKPQYQYIAKSSLWAIFLARIANLNAKLSSLNLSDLSQDLKPSHGYHKNNVFFARRTGQSETPSGMTTTATATRTSRKNWTGNDFKRASKDLINSLIVDWPEEPLDDDSESPYSEDEMESDEGSEDFDSDED
ncbi:hypothetical protein M426DRAFT_317366 [Hypoxylon sp. CI-4A]|nr:hypothetical protein M426DRAFT_317366 [Hypoxylon sp. CI-4A]